jgi:nucleotide-binding universal stress UspA family protein
MFEKILVATDGSEHGMRAAKVALELGERSSGTVSVIYVADTNQTSYLPDDVLLFSIRELLLKEGKEAVKQVEMMAKDAGVNCESIIVEGNPGSEVVDFAEKAGMNIGLHP